MMKFKTNILLLVLFVLAPSCGKKNRFYIDAEKNRVEVKIQRFDIDLIRFDTANLQESVDALFEKYPVFLPLYIENMTNSPINERDSIGELLNDFVSYPSVQELNQKVSEKFADISSIQKEIAGAFAYIHYYFPNLTLPELYFYVSGMNMPMILNRNRSILGIGTDFYLGADFPPYKEIVYDYMLQQFASERLPIDVVSAIIFSNFRFDGSQNRLLDNMLFRGKGLYLLSVFFPDRNINELIGYNTEQWQWAVDNEREIWRTMVARKDLFSTDRQTIRKYMEASPFTTPISQESPGRLGEWIGFRIVESFMNNNKKVTLPELMRMNNYQEMLQKSEY